jgi:hypothetical protein|nr:MAG TPA: hypothetical protein [Bacteriophage sp.]
MKNIALFVYIVLVLLVKALGFAFIVSMVLWLLGLFNIAGNTVLGLFVSTIALALIAGGLMEMIKIDAL